VFQKQMLEKRIWICSVMLVGATHGGVSVGAVDIEFHTEVSFAIDIFSKIKWNFVWINFSINIYIGEYDNKHKILFYKLNLTCALVKWAFGEVKISILIFCNLQGMVGFFALGDWFHLVYRLGHPLCPSYIIQIICWVKKQNCLASSKSWF